MMTNLISINSFSGDDPISLLLQAIEISKKVVFSTAFGKEDQAITYLIQGRMYC